MHMIREPFFLLAPDSLRLPLVILATLATVIASPGRHFGRLLGRRSRLSSWASCRASRSRTPARARPGQIYIPVINWTLMVMVILLVFGFRTSTNLAAAYGIAVTGAMLIDTCLLAVLLFSLWKWNRIGAGAAHRALRGSSISPISRRTSPRCPTAGGSRCSSG